MNSKALLFLAMLLATILLICAESAPKDLDNKDEKIDTNGYYGGGGYGGPWRGGGYGGWGGGYGGRGGYGGWRGGGWRGGWGGGGWRGGYGGGHGGWGGGWPNEHHDAYTDAEPHN
ncbi:glycine-rich RNA-binding protein 10 [Medicago truncatula]|nr:glycine-rich RNA-binding protein 10-like [Medicago truncatula]KEH40712.1 hypothetical protein MTR_1g033670 [Medicago truncatula]